MTTLASLATGFALSVFTTLAAWLGANAYLWAGERSPLIVLVVSVICVVVIVGAALLAARLLRPLHPNLWALGTPILLTAVLSYLWVSVNVTSFSALGGAWFVIFFVFGMQQRSEKKGTSG